MAEYIAVDTQVVSPNDAVLFSDMTVRGNCRLMHREGSGLFTLIAPNTCPCKGKVFKISVCSNIAIPPTGTAGEISAAIAINGEVDNATRMIVTPAEVNQYFNVSRTISVIVPGGCCTQISLENTSTVEVQFANTTIGIEEA